MVAIWSRCRVAMLGSLGIVVVVAAAIAGPAAQGATHAASVTAKAPPGIKAGLSAVAAPPRSSDVWALGGNGSVTSPTFFVGRRHGGRWHRAKTPNLGGRYGGLDVVAAASAKSVWLGGAWQQAHGFQEVPAIWRWTGKRFAAAKLPKLQAGAVAVTSVSASSATNAWAVGGIYPVALTTQAALHWNGKRWSAVAIPESLQAVSTSSASNAWGLQQGVSAADTLFHWNGKAWSANATVPIGPQLYDVATSSAKLACAVGAIPNTMAGGPRPVVLRFNGQTWSTARLKGVPRSTVLTSVTMAGKSAWAVGFRTTAKGATVAVIAHSTGGVWKIQQTLSKNYSLRAISAASAKRADAVGYYSNGSTFRSFADAYNGHRWSGVPSKF